MSEGQIKFLDELGMRAKRTGGYKLAKTVIIRACLEVLRKLSIDLRGVKTEKELAARILDAVRKYK
ncbi:MAG: hypothetical protein JW873_00410 [Candidatus Saganbacteria bacterium]|nr:hypothetical protein [Candidatus Saganbacteria bacterium]